MKEEDIITAIIFVAAVFLLGCWFYQDEIKALWYLMDTAMLGVLQFIPFLGDRYAGMLSDYRAVQASWPSYWQYLVVGQSVWRPFMIMIMMPMCFLWAFKSKKKGMHRALIILIKLILISTTVPLSLAKLRASSGPFDTGFITTTFTSSPGEVKLGRIALMLLSGSNWAQLQTHRQAES